MYDDALAVDLAGLEIRLVLEGAALDAADDPLALLVEEEDQRRVDPSLVDVGLLRRLVPVAEADLAEMDRPGSAP